MGISKPTATQVRVIDDDAVYRKTLYRLNPPFNAGLYQHDHVLVLSSPALGFSEHMSLTNAYASDEGGRLGSFLTSVYGNDDYAKVLVHLGYVIESEPVHAFTDESTHVDEVQS